MGSKEESQANKTTNEAMIQVENLGKFYGSFEALKGISFSVGRGEIVGFLGPNGAGKTTTMKILTGYISATSGHFKVAGFDGFEESLHLRQQIGYLPENAPLYPDMGLVDYLKFVCEIRNIAPAKRKAQISRMIDVCGLSKMVRKDIGELSKGYRQRVGLAQALIHDPQILILDEPTSGLDPNQIVEIRKLIKDLGQDRTIILSTHNLPEVQATCSRMIIISNGTKVADGTAEELERQGAADSSFIVGIHGSGDSDVTSRLSAVEGATSVTALGEREGISRYAVSVSGHNDISGAIFKQATAANWELRELRRDVVDLEKIFHQLTQY